MEVTIGGNRVGSGEKMKARLNNYYRSTHNLTEKFTSSAGVGILYPYMCKLMTRGDVFKIRTDADCRTIPAKGALFGSFKLQLDAYFCPIRLYVGLLHNNPTAIGLNMSQIKYPKIEIKTEGESDGNTYAPIGFSRNCLMKYLGVSGLGCTKVTEINYVKRKFNAIPMLAYYDIFKNYYANKQEKKGYCIVGNSNEAYQLQASSYIVYDNYDDDPIRKPSVVRPYDQNNIQLGLCDIATWNYNLESWRIRFNTQLIEDKGGKSLEIRYPSLNELKNMLIWVWIYPQFQYFEMTLGEFLENVNIYNGDIEYNDTTGEIEIYYAVNDNNSAAEIEINGNTYTLGGISIARITNVGNASGIVLQNFDLTNIDDMRYALLSHHTLGTPFDINSSIAGSKHPYLSNWAIGSNDITLNKFALNGLCIKTYQNDIFNNWLDTTWIEGANGIAALTAVDVTNNKFSLDELNFKEKLYNLLNRIAVSGNTYEDWQDVVYEEKPKLHMETPIFVGGMSKEIVFDEVIQTSESNGNKALGTMGGRGRAAGGKGGKFTVKADEAGFLIGIVSITPRINYNQGNEFYMTDIESMDDLHKPGMDGIGFQDLLGERMAYFDTIINSNNTITRHKVGKLPAWIEYMTSVDRTYGDFAYAGDSEDIPSYMVLNRNYELNETTGQIKDATTYIDPTKYNYAFAFTGLDAQNFWIQIKSEIIARRIMSARLIPNV